MSKTGPSATSRLRRWIFGGLLLALVVWVVFFDSHSLLKRYQWHQELDALTEENRALRQDIQRLQEKLDRPLSDQIVERIAREEYGMKRPGETIYRVNPE